MILTHLSIGYSEVTAFEMIAHVIPLTVYPKTYNKQPLMLVATGSIVATKEK